MAWTAGAREEVSAKDIPISVGGLFTGWNPISYTEYGEDDDFTRPVAQLVHRIWKASQP